MSKPLEFGDAAAWMLVKGIQDPSWRSKRKVPVYRGCYICEDIEFELMGLPLCWPCPYCCDAEARADAGHVPADDTVCSVCGRDTAEEMMRCIEAENQITVEGEVVTDASTTEAAAASSSDGEASLGEGSSSVAQG